MWILGLGETSELEIKDVGVVNIWVVVMAFQKNKIDNENTK